MQRQLSKRKSWQHLLSTRAATATPLFLCATAQQRETQVMCTLIRQVDLARQVNKSAQAVTFLVPRYQRLLNLSKK